MVWMGSYNSEANRGVIMAKFLYVNKRLMKSKVLIDAMLYDNEIPLDTNGNPMVLETFLRTPDAWEFLRHKAMETFNSPEFVVMPDDIAKTLADFHGYDIQEWMGPGRKCYVG